MAKKSGKSKMKAGASDLGTSAEVYKPVLDRIFDTLVAEADKLQLTRHDWPSRATFSSNGGRVVALEKGKRQVTLHLPKSVKDVESTLKKTFDKRGFGYVRVKTEDQVAEATALIQKAKPIESEEEKKKE